MSTAPAICPPPRNTTASEPTPGISAAEVRIITASARRFLHQFGANTSTETMVAITTQVTTLRDPYTPMAVDTYTCYKPDKSHWCTNA